MSGRGGALRREQPVDLRQWATASLRALGWKSKVEAQKEQRTRALDTAKTVDQNTLRDDKRPNSSTNLTRAKLDPGKEFKDFLRQLAYFEKASPEARPGLKEELRKAAQAYIDHYADHSARQKKQPQNISKKAACEDVLSELRKLDLADEVKGLGDPPWDSAKSMKAASLQATLDFESLPKGARTVEGVGGTHAVAAFWINGKPAGGKTEKNFLFKPAMEVKSLAGFPDAGEPAREVAAGRMADLLAGSTGLDFGMPETNLVSVDRSRFPEGSIGEGVEGGNDPDKPLVGSLQTFTKNSGGLREQSLSMREKVPTEAVQKVMLLDMMTLNCDRHGDNMLIGTDTNGDQTLLPIDHGLSFPEPGAQANGTIAEKLGGPFCATLALPGAHEPFTPEMMAAIQSLAPNAIKAAMEKELATMGDAFPDAASKIKRESLELARRSALFLKLAVANNPPLTPAAAQVAFAQHTPELLDLALNDNAFNRLAQGFITAAAGQQGALGELFTLPKDELGTLYQTLIDNGWTQGPTGKVSERWLTGNPKLALDVYRCDLKQPAKLKAMNDRFGAQEVTRLLQTMTLAVLYRDQDRHDSGRPPDLGDEAQQALDAFEQAFPRMAKVKRSDQSVARGALALWKRIEAAGGANQIAAACQQAGYAPAPTALAIANPQEAVEVLELAQGMAGSGAALTGADPDSGEIQRAFAYLDRLVALLPNNDPHRQEVTQAKLVQDAGNVRTRRVKALRLKVMDAVRVALSTRATNIGRRLQQKFDQADGDDKIGWQIKLSQFDQAKGSIGNGSLEEGKLSLDGLEAALV
jgi:hypothetical protein